MLCPRTPAPSRADVSEGLPSLQSAADATFTAVPLWPCAPAALTVCGYALSPLHSSLPC